MSIRHYSHHHNSSESNLDIQRGESSSAAATTATTRLIKRRNRPFASCIPCHERHVKCDRTLPCLSCIGANRQDECRFSLPILQDKPSAYIVHSDTNSFLSSHLGKAKATTNGGNSSIRFPPLQRSITQVDHHDRASSDATNHQADSAFQRFCTQVSLSSFSLSLSLWYVAKSEKFSSSSLTRIGLGRIAGMDL